MLKSPPTVMSCLDFLIQIGYINTLSPDFFEFVHGDDTCKLIDSVNKEEIKLKLIPCRYVIKFF